jgi:hypothetical protein
MSDPRIKTAFLEIREGKSPEYVICDPALNEVFLAAARRLGVEGSDGKINAELLGFRKRNELHDCPTAIRKKADPNRHHYLNPVLNTARFVERQFEKNVDDVICDPDARAQFDAMIQFLCPGTIAFEARYAALSLRKSNRLKPEPVGQVIHAVGGNILCLLDLEERLNELPTNPGVYIFFDEEETLYAGKADSIRARIRDHISTWTYRHLIQQMREAGSRKAFVVYHELPVTISGRELAAYETELIRSRNPEHNRAGRIP